MPRSALLVGHLADECRASVHTSPLADRVIFPLVDKGFWLPVGFACAWQMSHRIEHMFEGDLTTLSTADLLESAAEHRAVANRADARLLEHAQVYADRFHPSVCPIRPGRRPVMGGSGRWCWVVTAAREIAEFAIAEFGVMIGRLAAGRRGLHRPGVGTAAPVPVHLGPGPGR